MSSAVNNLGTFDPKQYKNNGTGNKTSQRMAGDYLSEFANQNANDKKDQNTSFSYQGNNGKTYRTNTEQFLFGNSKPKDTNVNSTANKAPAAAQQEQPQASGSSTPKTVSAAKPQQNSVTYDEDKYRYYDSDFGSGTGAAAYAKDMEGYNNMVAMNEGDGLAAGHLGLVAQMMHPDWGRSQRAGGGAEDPTEQNYRQAPTGARYGPGGKQQGRFDGGGSKGQQKKYGGGQVQKFQSNNGGWQ